MRESQYIDEYLDAAEKHGWTPSTFLGNVLTGTAANYSDRYHKALMNAINRRLESGDVVKATSARGKTCYKRAKS